MIAEIEQTTATLNKWASTTLTGFSTSTPGTSRPLEGTITRASGGCDAAVGTITSTISSTPIVRLDN